MVLRMHRILWSDRCARVPTVPYLLSSKLGGAKSLWVSTPRIWASCCNRITLVKASNPIKMGPALSLGWAAGEQASNIEALRVARPDALIPRVKMVGIVCEKPAVAQWTHGLTGDRRSGFLLVNSRVLSRYAVAGNLWAQGRFFQDFRASRSGGLTRCFRKEQKSRYFPVRTGLVPTRKSRGFKGRYRQSANLPSRENRDRSQGIWRLGSPGCH